MKITKNEDHVLLKNNDGEYHISLSDFDQIGEEEAIKLAKSEIEKKKSSNYKKDTINFTEARELGFCEYGIKDFCNRLGLNKDNTYKITDLNKALTLEVLKKYPEECIKLFGKDTLKYLGGVKGVLNKDTVDLVLIPEFIEEKKLHELSVKFAYDCLPIFEKEYPNDDRPRKAIEAKQKWIEGKITDEELEVARNEAWSAYSAAESAVESADAAADAARSARSAARSVAYSVASSAWSTYWSAADSATWFTARERQVKMILEVL